MSKRRIAVTIDTFGSTAMGIGHVVRSRAIAAELRRLGARAALADRRATPPDVLVVDRPDTSRALLARHAVRWPATPIVALDYYGDAPRGVAAVINLNQARERAGAVKPRRYARSLRYATLRPSFQRRRAVVKRVPASIRRVVVGFGGTDPLGWTAAAVSSLRAALPRDVAIHVLSGRQLALDADRGVRVHVHVGLKDPAALMHGADLALIGGGTMMMEAACLGVPAVVVPRTEAERVFAREFTRAGAVRLVDAASAFPARAVEGAVRALDADRPARSRMRAAGRRLIDGCGTTRVARLILEVGLDAGRGRA